MIFLFKLFITFFCYLHIFTFIFHSASRSWSVIPLITFLISPFWKPWPLTTSPQQKEKGNYSLWPSPKCSYRGSSFLWCRFSWPRTRSSSQGSPQGSPCQYWPRIASPTPVAGRSGVPGAEDHVSVGLGSWVSFLEVLKCTVWVMVWG